MKIVHEVNQLDFGGVEKIVRNIVKYDKKNEHSVIAYKDGAYREHLEKVGAKCVVLPEGNEDIDMEADIIHVHCGGAISELARSLEGQFPIIETIHSPVRSPNPSRIITQRVGVTEAVARMNDRAICIHNGIDFEDMVTRFDKDELKLKQGLPLDKPVIGRLGRLGQDKGLEEWILTCAQLQREGLEFTPLIIGPEARDCEGYRGRLKLMCESLPLKNVMWLARTNDIADFMQVMDIFLYPSATEGFGLVLIEAMHSGAIVVSYDNDVNREIIGGYSILVSPKEGIAGLAKAVRKGLETGLRDEILGMQMSFVEDQYNAERMSKDYQELYERSDRHFNGTAEPEKADVLPA